MENLEEKPTSELQSIYKDLEMTHDKIKQQIIKSYDELDSVERQYARVMDVLRERTH